MTYLKNNNHHNYHEIKQNFSIELPVTIKAYITQTHFLYKLVTNDKFLHQKKSKRIIRAHITQFTR